MQSFDFGNAPGAYQHILNLIATLVDNCYQVWFTSVFKKATQAIHEAGYIYETVKTDNWRRDIISSYLKSLKESNEEILYSELGCLDRVKRLLPPLICSYGQTIAQSIARKQELKPIIVPTPSRFMHRVVFILSSDEHLVRELYERNKGQTGHLNTRRIVIETIHEVVQSFVPDEFITEMLESDWKVTEKPPLDLYIGTSASSDPSAGEENVFKNPETISTENIEVEMKPGNPSAQEGEIKEIPEDELLSD